jgi:hypothetical protein
MSMVEFLLSEAPYKIRRKNGVKMVGCAVKKRLKLTGKRSVME